MLNKIYTSIENWRKDNEKHFIKFTQIQSASNGAHKIDDYIKQILSYDPTHLKHIDEFTSNLYEKYKELKNKEMEGLKVLEYDFHKFLFISKVFWYLFWYIETKFLKHNTWQKLLEK